MRHPKVSQSFSLGGLTAVNVGKHSNSSFGIDKVACLLVCVLEFSSIISNILKPKGYSLNLKVLVAALLGKATGGTKEDFQNVIEKENYQPQL